MSWFARKFAELDDHDNKDVIKEYFMERYNDIDNVVRLEAYWKIVEDRDNGH